MDSPCRADSVLRRHWKHLRLLRDTACSVWSYAANAGPVRLSDGNSLLTDKESILNRWTEHYESLFGDKHYVQEEAIRKIPQQAVKTELDIPPTQQEVKAAIAKMKRHKAPGVNSVPAEVYKYGGVTLLPKLTDLFQKCWESGVAPQDLCEGVIVSPRTKG